MKIMPFKGTAEIVNIGIAPGEMLLETICAAIETCGIRNGAVISGIGTLKTCRLHYVTHTHFPPENAYYTFDDKPLELLSVSGLIADGEPHLHIVVSCGDREVYGGHLHEGSEVLYLAEIGIMVYNDCGMVRTLDGKRKVSLLGPKS